MPCSNSAAAAAAWLVLIVLSLVALSMLYGGFPALRTFGLSFIYSTDWNPVTKRFGAGVAIYGTLVTSALAMLMAVPVSFGIAVFLTEVAPARLRGPVAAAIELLAGVPSIIYGMWGLFIFVPIMSNYIEPWIDANLGALPGIGVLFSGPPLGIGMLTAGIILAIMVIPFVSSVMRDVFALVPPQLREASFALGATRWEVVRSVVLPYTAHRRGGRHLPRPRPGARRDDGGDLRARQRARLQYLAADAGQLHLRGDRQRVHRGRTRSSTCRR